MVLPMRLRNRAANLFSLSWFIPFFKPKQQTPRRRGGTEIQKPQIRSRDHFPLLFVLLCAFVSLWRLQNLIDHFREFINTFSSHYPASREQGSCRKAFPRPHHM